MTDKFISIPLKDTVIYMTLDMESIVISNMKDKYTTVLNQRRFINIYFWAMSVVDISSGRIFMSQTAISVW